MSDIDNVAPPTNMLRPRQFIPDTLELGTVRLSPVDESHAEYIFSLRIDNTLNTFLSAAPSSVHDEREWITKYRDRAKEGSEYYFVIVRIGGMPCGTVRLYDFRADSFCWGSWILDKNKTRYAAVESAMLVYRLGFRQLGFTGSHFDVRKGNEKVIAFHRRFGAEMTHEDDENVYMFLSRSSYEKVEPELLLLTTNCKD